MEESLSYKCPSCSAPLAYEPGNDTITCEYCGTEFSIEELDAIYRAEAAAAEKAAAAVPKEAPSTGGEAWDTGAAGSSWEAGEAEYLQTLFCSSCGAELVADVNTMATECCYCGNPAMALQRFSGMLRPDYVIPFRQTKEDAIAALTRFTKGKRLLPDAFLRDKRFEKIQSMYVPFWLFSAEVFSEGVFDCTRTRSYSDGDDDVTETSHFRCVRTATADFLHVPVDGSVKMNDTYMESIEPFDYREMVPFSMVYMAGHLADKYDVDAAASVPRADGRIHQTMIEGLARDLSGDYESVSEEGSSTTKNTEDVKYALAPVWILSTRYRDKIYTFMMNGQTGKIIGTLPSDEGKQRMYMALTFLAVLGLNYFLSGVHFYAPFVFLAVVLLLFIKEKLSFRAFLKAAEERGESL